MMGEAKTDVLAFTAFPKAHWQKIWSNNPIERLNKEIKRRADVVEIFPNPAAFLRLATAVVIESHDEWQVSAERRALVNELTYSYRFLSQFARNEQTAIPLNSRDLGVLGRRLYAAFERKAGKIEFINPGIAPDLAEDTLTLVHSPSPEAEGETDGDRHREAEREFGEAHPEGEAERARPQPRDRGRGRHPRRAHFGRDHAARPDARVEAPDEHGLKRRQAREERSR